MAHMKYGTPIDVPVFWVNIKTGNKYPKREYSNHGFGGLYKGMKDLPSDEYPYTLEYKTEYKDFKVKDN